ncbi:aliphatic sulfonates family ABC transporter, periplsmic ligand-binding protein [Thermosinus carboxydivorans Nor1]|uniref:Aliphatic sulfonates family ABC transporter, periplsmic ligand-binding protein n=1 Tax=Thermosinus carboxydivorans Nor1 TaxID=401526 RepID=A1HSY1_9FIRM|nr:ABC transporter substrate-binding protein [Thermosinus carboxydivorans]EAX46837.1 aliphatic sulfonates family ABC transporter, periplsmic ligand-binding protein [Thermosinus carboxydivorans Nor1]
MSKKIVALVLAAVMVAVLVAGCGSGNKPAAQQPAAKEPIKIALPTFTGYGPLLVAKEKGFFKNKGLDVEIQVIDGLGERKQALMANKIQGMATALDVSVTMAGDGVPVKILWAFDTSNGADGILVKNNKGINSVADLKGKEIALPEAATSHFFLLNVLDKAGMSDKDVKIVNMTAGEAGAAFVAGKVDAAVTWEPWLTKGAKADGKVLVSTKDLPGVIVDVVFLREDFVKAHPDQVQAFVAALKEATDFMMTNKDEAYKIIANGFKMKPEEISADMQTLKFYGLQENLAFFGTPDKPGPIYDVTKKAGQFYFDKKKISKVPNPADMIDASFLSKLK